MEEKENESKPISVSVVNILGASRTRSSLLDNIFADVWKAKTAPGLVLLLGEALVRLQALDIMSAMNVVVDKREEDGVAVDVFVKEKRPYRLRLGTSTGSSSRGLDISAGLKNWFGHAEKFELDVKAGIKKDVALDLNFRVPELLHRRSVLDVSLFRERKPRRKSGFAELETGTTVTSEFVDSRHSFCLSCALREIVNIPSEVDPRLLVHMTDSVKTSLKYSFLSDERNNPLSPLSGHTVKCSAELGLPPGDATFVRGGFRGQLWKSILRDRLTFKGTVFGGISMNVLGSSSLHLPDRVQLDNNVIHAFSQDTNCDTGGYSMIGGELGGSFVLPVKLLQSLNITGHTWVNAYLLSDVPSLLPRGTPLQSSCGVGLHVPTPAGRVEVNYCVPLNCRGEFKQWQLGVGIDLP